MRRQEELVEAKTRAFEEQKEERDRGGYYKIKNRRKSAAELLRRKRAGDKRKKRIADEPKWNITNESSQNNNQPNSVDDRGAKESGTRSTGICPGLLCHEGIEENVLRHLTGVVE